MNCLVLDRITKEILSTALNLDVRDIDIFKEYVYIYSWSLSQIKRVSYILGVEFNSIKRLGEIVNYFVEFPRARVFTEVLL